MPNNGIISRYANIPSSFIVEEAASTDLVIINTPLSGSRVEQKAVPVSALGGSLPYKEIYFQATFYYGQTFPTAIYKTTEGGVNVDTVGEGIYRIWLDNVVDRPTSVDKIQISINEGGVNGYTSGSTPIIKFIYDPGQIVNQGNIVVRTLIFNQSSHIWENIQPAFGVYYPVYIRIYS